LLAGPAVLAPGPARASGFDEAFQAKAVAGGIRFTLVVPKGSVSDTIVDVGAPTAEALLDSLGESRAFASYPYPGDTAANLPGLLRGLAGIPAPAYPFYAASFHPSSPQAQAGIGPYLILAESTEAASTATASVGYQDELAGSAARMRSQAMTVSEQDSVTAAASNEITGFAVGPLRLGQVLSSAEVVLSAGGQLRRQADTNVVGAMVGDTPVVVTSDGVRLADTTAPGPDTAAVAETLSEAGIGISMTAAEETSAGVIAPALRVTYQTPDHRSAVWEIGAASATMRTAEGSEGPPPATQSGSVSEPIRTTRVQLVSTLMDGGNLRPLYELVLLGVVILGTAGAARLVIRRSRAS
jgi:hypothetical protein